MATSRYRHEPSSISMHATHATHATHTTRSWLLFALVAASALLLGGCHALGNSSCQEHSTGFGEVVAQEGQLDQAALESAAVDPGNTQYPMAVLISQPAINKLFAAVAGADLPDIPLRATVYGYDVGVTISPALPLIQIGGANDCVECLLTQIGMGLAFDIEGYQFGGSGVGTYQFPLMMSPTAGLESTSVVAGFDSLEVLDLQIDIDLGDFPDEAILGFFKPEIERAVQSLVRQQIGQTHLVDLESWELGDGDVKLVGHGPHIDAATQSIVIGMHSNLMRAGGASLDWKPGLPEGADIGLQFHPELVHSMIGRLMNEGHIERSYTESGQASETGAHQVTLSHMRSRSDQLLDTGFRLWRTGGGFCGYADMQAGLGLSISDKQLKLAVQDVQVTDSAGAGQLLQYASSWAGSDFLQNVVNFSELTLNYDRFSLPNNLQADMSAEAFELNLDARGLSLFLNIEQIVGIDEISEIGGSDGGDE